jgi:hypothetical protein
MFSCSSPHKRYLHCYILFAIFSLFSYSLPFLSYILFAISNCHNIITVHGRVPASVPWFALAR